MQAYNDWQSNPTMTILQTTGKPVSDVEFPAITICGHGSIHQVNHVGYHKSKSSKMYDLLYSGYRKCDKLSNG